LLSGKIFTTFFAQEKIEENKFMMEKQNNKKFG
jgi:hypothetical protein